MAFEVPVNSVTSGHHWSAYDQSQVIHGVPTDRRGARLRLARRYQPAIARNLRRVGIAIRTAPLLLAKPRLLLLWLQSARRAELAWHTTGPQLRRARMLQIPC